MILTFLFERLYFDQNFDQNSIQFFLQPLYFESNFEKDRFRLSATTSPAEDSEADGGLVVPPSSRVLRSHARLAKSAGLAEALAFDPAFDSLC